jgi:hypothetical protein
MCLEKKKIGYNVSQSSAGWFTRKGHHQMLHNILLAQDTIYQNNQIQYELATW